MGSDLPGHVPTPIKVQGATAIEEICRFRVDVWRQTGSLAEDAFQDGQWRDDAEEHCTHWVVRDAGGQLLAAARWGVVESFDQVQEVEEYKRYGLSLAGVIAEPARVVVASSARRMGLATKLLDIQDEASRGVAAQHAVRQASPAMARLLVRRGWKVLGPSSTDPRFSGVQFQVAVISYTGSS